MAKQSRKPVNQSKEATRSERTHVSQVPRPAGKLRTAAAGRREAVNQSRVKT